MIKWQPFDSVIPSKDIISSILDEKEKMVKPILSPDQLFLLNDLLLESFYTQSKIKIKYFKNNSINLIEGTITAINQQNRLITINNSLKLHISQILQINT